MDDNKTTAAEESGKKTAAADPAKPLSTEALAREIAELIAERAGREQTPAAAAVVRDALSILLMREVAKSHQLIFGAELLTILSRRLRMSADSLTAEARQFVTGTRNENGTNRN